jgi:hypothetical protein
VPVTLADPLNSFLPRGALVIQFRLFLSLMWFGLGLAVLGLVAGGLGILLRFVVRLLL